MSGVALIVAVVLGGLVVWTAVAVLAGIVIGRGIRAADWADEKQNWVIPPAWGDGGAPPP